MGCFRNLEYDATSITFDGEGLWGEFFTVVSELDANRYGCTNFDAINHETTANVDDGSCYYSIQQEVSLDGVMLNNIAICLDLGNPSVSNVFENNEIVFVTDDTGSFYIPSNGVNTIENMQNNQAYQVLLSGQADQILTAEGYPLDFANTPIVIEPFLLNNIPYLPAEPTAAADFTNGLPVVFCADDEGHYYIPGSGVNTIDESGGMLPGKGYQVLISGSESIEFNYSDATDEGLTRSVGVVGASYNYDITRTGVSHPIIIDELTGAVADGDELVAYADGVAVGVATINTNDTNLLVAWKSLADYGIDTDGYYDGDEIELRLFSQELGKELMVTHSFNAETYGALPVTVGSIHVHNQAAVPGTFALEQNYPNPFNPSTTIDVSVASDSQITLNVYDINGRLVSTLANDVYEAGYHSFIWNGLDQTGNKVSAGIYFYSLFAGEMTVTKKMMLMK